MSPNCKYCHSTNQTLLTFENCKAKLTCDLCSEFGRFKRNYPRRNEESSKSGKKRKVFSGLQKTAVATSSSPSPIAKQSLSKATVDTTAADAEAIIKDQAAVDATRAAVDATRATADAHDAAFATYDAHAAAVANAATDATAIAAAKAAAASQHHHYSVEICSPTSRQ